MRKSRDLFDNLNAEDVNAAVWSQSAERLALVIYIRFKAAQRSGYRKEKGEV